jgi:hypothetical protein
LPSLVDSLKIIKKSSFYYEWLPKNNIYPFYNNEQISDIDFLLLVWKELSIEEAEFLLNSSIRDKVLYEKIIDLSIRHSSFRERMKNISYQSYLYFKNMNITRYNEANIFINLLEA